MLAPVPSELSIALKRSEHLVVAVSEPHILDQKVLSMPLRQRVRHAQPQGQRAVIGNIRNAQLATSGFITAPQYEKLVAPGILPGTQPFFMAAITIGLKVMLLPPQPLRAEAEPHPAHRNVSFQCRQPVPQIGQPAPLMMHLIPAPTLNSLGNLKLSPANPALKVIQPQPHALLDSGHLPFQRHPHAVEHPSRDPVSLQIHLLQRRR